MRWLIVLLLAGEAAAAPCKPDPPAFGIDPAGQVCDLPDRILVVGDKDVTAIDRPSLHRSRAPISRTEYLPDRCDGPGGGHAGCSITFHRYWSRVLGTDYLEFGNNIGNGIGDEACRQDTSYQVVATCSTAHRFALVKRVEADNGCAPLEVWLWEGASITRLELDADARDQGDRWIVTFPDGQLVFDRKTQTLELGGEREACVAASLWSGG